jgi:quercetin dioxygenase-like cupin family protein
VLFQVGDSRTTLRAGESILGPRGIPHAFSGVGEKPAHMSIAFTPARRTALHQVLVFNHE